MELKPSKNKAKEIALEVKDVWESFRIYHQRNQTIKDTLVRWKKSVYEEFWALKGVSFKVHKGETIGIIGENGSGKSTLLKCIAGILQPSKGSIKVNGKISPLLELGAGFHPELSGRENIYVNGAILGLTKKQIDKQFDKIVEFSELENFIDTQVKFYSSGMYIRLGFAIAVFSDPDILLVDEVLAVGDENFRQKCYAKFEDFKSQGKTIILVSHDMEAVDRFCKKIFLLQSGQMIKEGEPKEIIKMYISKPLERKATEEKGSKEIIIDKVELIDYTNNLKRIFFAGEAMKIRLHFRVNSAIKDPIFGIAIYDHCGNNIYGTNTILTNNRLIELRKDGSIDFHLSYLPMVDGIYYLSVTAHAPDNQKVYHLLDKCFSFEITSSGHDNVGKYFIPISCSFSNNEKNNQFGLKKIKTAKSDER